MPRKPALYSTVPPVKKPEKEKKVLQKACACCEGVKNITEFYTNRGENKGYKRDRWCKSCYKEKVTDEATLRVYMFNNNRMWSKELWEVALNKAQKEANASPEYVSLTDDDVREVFVEKKAIAIFPTVMNQPAFYKHFDSNAVAEEFDVIRDMETEREMQRDSEDPYYVLPVYSKEWGGRYTRYEIDFMNNYYESIIKTRGIEDSIGENYAKQFVKQSMMVDSLAEKMRMDSSKEVSGQFKEAVASLEVLSQAAQLAPRYRKTESSFSVGSLAEFIRAMEYGKLMIHEPDFAPDQIDGMIANLRHLAAAIGGSGGLWDSEVEK